MSCGDHIGTFQPEESAVGELVWSGIGEKLEMRRVNGPMGGYGLDLCGGIPRMLAPLLSKVWE